MADMDYAEAKRARAVLEAEVARLSRVLHTFPRGAAGLTPDHIKNSDPYRSAQQAYTRAFSRLRRFNKTFMTAYQTEIAAERRRTRPDTGVDENADYDVGQHPQNKPDQFGKDNNEFTDKGKADVKNRSTSARYGDNTMEPDGGALREDLAQDSTLDRLHHMLNQAGVDDEDIRRGAAALSPEGTNKVASWLGIGADGVQTLLNSLVTKLRQDDDQMLRDAYQASVVEAADGGTMLDPAERFHYEEDAMGNVTVRDRLSGRQAYLQGSEGMDLLRDLHQHPASAQQRLAMLAPLMEATDLEATDGAPGGSFLPEIEADPAGAYNFTWHYGARHGIGRASFAEHDGRMQLELREIYDATGEPVVPDPMMRDALARQARAAAVHNDI